MGKKSAGTRQEVIVRLQAEYFELLADLQLKISSAYLQVTPERARQGTHSNSRPTEFKPGVVSIESFVLVILGRKELR